jgi:phasin family protein
MATRPKNVKAPDADPDAAAPAALQVEEAVSAAAPAALPVEEAVSATVAAVAPTPPTDPEELGMTTAVPVLALAAPGPDVTDTKPVGTMPAHATQNMEKMMKNAEEFLSFSQGNVEALVKSGQIWAAGWQDLSKQMAASAQTAMDETMSAFKAMTSVKSLKEALDLQATLARSTVEKAVTGSGQFADASFKLAEQTMAPLTARFQLAAQKFTPAA